MNGQKDNLFDKVLERCTKEEQQQLKLYKGRWLQALKRSATDASAVNTEIKCKKAYESLLEQLFAKYFKSGRFFTSGGKAILFLKEQDFKISKTKFYEDVKKGLIRKVSGRYYEEDLLEYARKNLKRNTIEGKSLTLQEEILKEELALKRLKREREELKREIEEGQYLYVDDVRRMLAMRAAVFKHDLMAMVDDFIPELVKTVGGKPDMIPKALKETKEQIYSILRRYSEGEILIKKEVLEEVEGVNSD